MLTFVQEKNDMEQTHDFEQIRPFTDDEVAPVIEQLCNEPYFVGILGYIFPGMAANDVLSRLKTIKTIDEFQEKFIIPFLSNLMKNTTEGVTADGVDKLSKKGGYLFVSNHRDIILDSALINIKLHEKGFETTEIGIGDNLLIYDWITDLVKLNKSFVVKRNLPVRQMMAASETLSAFIRHSIVKDKQNIWIAQREGRSKDGNDLTQSSVLKMFNLSGRSDMVENFKELNIVPVSISYELDPCDYLKAYQSQLKRDDENYQKSQREDLVHMNTGLNGRKGRVHLSFGSPITTELNDLRDLNKNAFITAVAEKIDKQVHRNYKLWPGNYIAYDILNGVSDYSTEYTEKEKNEFVEYVNEHISRLDNPDEDYIFDYIMKMYANPVINKLKAQEE